MDVVVGRIAKAHGVTGELTVEVRTDSPEERFADGAVVNARMRGGERRELVVESVRPHSGRLLVRFEQVVTREAAEALRGCLLVADTDALPPTDDPDEFYDHELEGLHVVLADGSSVGTVAEVVHVPGSELLAVDRPDGSQALIPFVQEIVPEIDIQAGRVVLTPPEGLLDPL
ncbi:16S rRNA processing protein RimM [Tamaricihabitans halophyticus]|uniref:Ribosome maturation factor RimM n=1 Tax=Tamaricihabitans halophyticus TaxID=1262583 RepID=A0A4V2STT4_9PSEU|nr:ribosome maturation factor RimM [Tamaricihabitans halophyticus]TCP51986.1 16S rRNA processing protein RimM [Tamaricihabitans halophyticus]